jgi:CBS domain-containing protein
MKVRDLMAGPPVTIAEADDVALGLQIMAWGDLRHLPVVRDGRLVGVVSERDLLTHRESNPRIAEVMTAPAEVASPDDDATEAARRMVDARLGCLPVLERGKLIGIVTVTDLVALQARPLPAKELRASVSTLMTRDPMTVAPDDLLLEAVRRMSEANVRHAPVVDEEHHVIGMLSDRDVRLALGAILLDAHNGEGAARVRLLKVRDAMSENPVVAEETASLAEAAAVFVRKGVGAVPVLDRIGRLAGIVSYVDLLRSVFEPRPLVATPAAQPSANPPHAGAR